MTSHALKSTLLSWAANGGVPKFDRRMLGYHAKPGDKSMMEYSRDLLAEPLTELRRVMETVRDGTFQRDNTRSGRWVKAPKQSPPPRQISQPSNHVWRAYRHTSGEVHKARLRTTTACHKKLIKSYTLLEEIPGQNAAWCAECLKA